MLPSNERASVHYALDCVRGRSKLFSAYIWTDKIWSPGNLDYKWSSEVGCSGLLLGAGILHEAVSIIDFEFTISSASDFLTGYKGGGSATLFAQLEKNEVKGSRDAVSFHAHH